MFHGEKAMREKMNSSGGFNNPGNLLLPVEAQIAVLGNNPKAAYRLDRK